MTDDPWTTAHERYAAGDKARGKVVKLADYGALVELEPGITGLIHRSQMSWTRRPVHPSDLLSEGDSVQAMVLRVDPEKRALKLGLKQLTGNPWATAHERYAVGGMARGEVVNLTDYGAFVEVEPGVTGLIHISDLRWKHVNHPAEVLAMGDPVEAVILGIEPERRRMSLGLKQLSEDPWATACERYAAGVRVLGDVFKVGKSGAFAEVEPGIVGFIHRGAMSWSRVPSPAEVPSEGDTVEAVVLDVDPEKRLLDLGLKQVNDDPWASAPERYPVESRARGEVVNLHYYGAFVELEPGIVGLIHISNLPGEDVSHPSDLLAVGDPVETVILDVDQERRRLSLGLLADAHGGDS